jgi:sulfoxide reductase catalytic subunit YedY
VHFSLILPSPIHHAEIPKHNDLDSFTITINGLVERELKLSVKDLKTRFRQVEVNAVLQCGGNSRSAFEPVAGGIQWGHGAMGCARWKGVRLRDVLEMAGLKKNAHWIGFNGMDQAAYYKTPNFVREIEIHELDENVLIAYEMNGEDLPYLNGFPVRLIMPGYYSDNWVKMLSEITVSDKYKSLFFMDVAYRVPDNKCECETPKKRAKKTKPITQMNVKSIIGFPCNDEKVYYGSHVVIRGVAFDGGYGIRKVEVSLDGGKSWNEAVLKEDLGRYSFREFMYPFKPVKYGKMKIMARATNNLGQTQPFAHEIGWNHGGYKFNGIDEVTIEVI